MDKLQPESVQKQNEQSIFKLIQLRDRCQNEGIDKENKSVKHELLKIQRENLHINVENYFYNILQNENNVYICK